MTKVIVVKQESVKESILTDVVTSLVGWVFLIPGLYLGSTSVVVLGIIIFTIYLLSEMPKPVSKAEAISMIEDMDKE